MLCQPIRMVLSKRYTSILWILQLIWNDVWIGKKSVWKRFFRLIFLFINMGISIKQMVLLAWDSKYFWLKTWSCVPVHLHFGCPGIKWQIVPVQIFIWMLVHILISVWISTCYWFYRSSKTTVHRCKWYILYRENYNGTNTSTTVALPILSRNTSLA